MWSNQRQSLIRGFNFYVRCRTTNMTLGTVSGNPDIHREFIISKIPEDDLERIQKTKEEEEIVNHTVNSIDEEVERNITVFPQAKFFFSYDGRAFDPAYDVIPEGLEGEYKIVPFLYDYQIRGAFKESISMLTRADGGKKNKEAGGTKYDCSNITSYKKTVDGNWFCLNRKIPMFVPDTYLDDFGIEQSTYDSHGKLKLLQRALRAETAQGPRVALSSSEIVPAGTEYYFGIRLLNIKDLKACLETLDYKALVGMLQWRGGGMGTFVWTLANKDGIPYDDLNPEQLTDEDRNIIRTVDAVYPGMVDLKRLGIEETTEQTEEAPAPKKRGRKPKAAIAE